MSLNDYSNLGRGEREKHLPVKIFQLTLHDIVRSETFISFSVLKKMKHNNLRISNKNVFDSEFLVAAYTSILLDGHPSMMFA